MFKIFGIRHHGPGSARALKRALEDWNPDAILIEGPPDADNLIRHVANEGLRPPVALLVYNPKNLQQASYFPFAEFSPEWQAMRFALQNKTVVAFMDLPQSLNFSLKNPDEPTQQSLDFSENMPENAENERGNAENLGNTEGVDLAEHLEKFHAKIENDPLNYMAQLAGFTDSERWWEATFEQNDNATDIFDAILEMMTALRHHLSRAETVETILREAYMRQTMRSYEKKGFTKIAVICGAWHAPVLATIQAFNVKKDVEMLKNIKKTPTEATWTPWTYDRLALSSGYGAGVTSPAWYDFLYSKRKTSVIRWLTKAARLLRKEDLSASSAHVIEAVRLAETLAILRGRSIAGLDELEEAALTVLCEGATSMMDLIRKKLIIGDIIGKVPPEVPQVPLQRDLEAAIKTARLSKEYATTEPITKELDLRKDTQLAASHLLHRITLLSIPWGKPMRGNMGRRQGSFAEIWKLQWKPDYAVRVIEGAQWGNTVIEAATNFVNNKTFTLEKLPELTELLQKTLDADLVGTLPKLVKRLQDISALTEDVLILIDALLPLINIIRYGNVRKSDATAVRFVLEQILPRIYVGLPSLTLHTDDDASELIFSKIQATHRALNLLNEMPHTTAWLQALRHIADAKTDTTHAKLIGLAVRLLFDKGIFDSGQTAIKLRFALSTGNEPLECAAWLEGFLDKNGLILIHYEALWYVVNEWVVSIEMTRFDELLPLLRRTFANFSPSEREKIFTLAQNKGITSAGIDETLPTFSGSFYDEKRAKAVLGMLKQVF